MPKSTVTVGHELGKDEALTRIKGILAQVKQQYGDRITNLEENWTDDGGSFSFQAMGFRMAGTLAVSDTDVAITGDYPWAAKPFQGTIEATLRERAERLLAR
ncbi:MAG TPA: polyhydroxyalkanoic acid system family protein [Thermomicrobiales bacterium]|nr:polyhydroxyalkanoic acid system family protein [Thermomicrobiales bacterium]